MNNNFNEKLDISSLENALESFKKALSYFHSNKNSYSEYIRDACIKRFEYSYELTTKMLRRHLANIPETPSEIKEYSFQKLIREGFSKGILLHSWDVWAVYRQNSNTTSNSYNENIAIDIVAEIPAFLSEAEYFLQKLKTFYED